MVRIRKRQIGKQFYYYLEQSLKIKGKLVKKELYLGKKIPKNIQEIKNNFMRKIHEQKWFSIIKKIKESYKKELKTLPIYSKNEELKKFAIRFTYDSQRIEGSTLNLQETHDLLEKSISPKNKPIPDIKEAESHNNVFLEMLDYKKDLSINLVLYWHKRIFQETKPEIAGRLRISHVLIARSKFTPPYPAELDILVHEFFRWYNNNKNKLNSVELAALVHLKFVTIHPFQDGNGRISRLMMNFILNKHDYPMINIQYENRNSYYNALERSQISNNDAIFLNWFMNRYVKENLKYINKKNK